MSGSILLFLFIEKIRPDKIEWVINIISNGRTY